ncbi:lanthionine synthetase C family protein [Actinoallomurus sp. CA-142502]|uniref:lanthionine synthetase C family protein n=1 Tax=Actinoallomurus sp. CA-142502 TaxID=3239885 RepID=UPI003D907EAB
MTTGTVRTEAAEIVAEVARRLADPAAVARITEGAVDRFPDGRTPPTWHPAALNEGCLGIALLHAELGDRSSAHAYLARGAKAAMPGQGSLFAGLPAVVFATRAAVTRPGDYASLLGRAEPAVRAAADERAREEIDRITAGRPGTAFAAYDVVQGLTGLGRLLLGTGHAEPAVRYLIALTEPVEVDGARVPGWWVPHAPLRNTPDGEGHFNLGLAHGVAGPLALLAIAHRDGLRLPGQEAAIERIVTWLLEWLHEGSWPSVVGFHRQLRGPDGSTRPDRPSWCYGAPGIARVLQLAGLALDRPSWRETAASVLRRALARPWDEWDMIDAGLCHGWAGMLHMTRLMAADDGADDLHEAVDGLARRVVGCFDPEAPFGFRYAAGAGAAVAPDRAGFLEGAAGIALALHGYANDGPANTGWDTALLLN